VTGYGSPLLHADCTAAPPSTTAFRARPVPGRRVTAGHHRPTEAGTAARRRLAAPVGPPPGRARLLPTPPARAVPRHSPLRPSS